MHEIDVSKRAAAPPQAVFRLLGDSRTWPRWTPIESATIEEPGAADGVGEVRTFTTGRVVVRERITERVPERRLVYELLAGLAVRDYRAEIDLTPASGGTDVRWHTTFRPKVPGTGWLYRRALAKATQGFVDGLVAAAPSAADRPTGS